MRAVRLVRQNQHTMAVCQFHDSGKVGTDAVVCRVVDQNSFCVRILQDRLFHLSQIHSQRNTVFLVGARVYIDRHAAAEHQRVDRAAVDVARQDNLFVLAAGG